MLLTSFTRAVSHLYGCIDDSRTGPVGRERRHRDHAWDLVLGEIEGRVMDAAVYYRIDLVFTVCEREGLPGTVEAEA